MRSHVRKIQAQAFIDRLRSSPDKPEKRGEPSIKKNDRVLVKTGFYAGWEGTVCYEAEADWPVQSEYKVEFTDHSTGWVKAEHLKVLDPGSRTVMASAFDKTLGERLGEPPVVTAELLDACWERWTTRSFNPPLTFKDYLKKELGL